MAPARTSTDPTPPCPPRPGAVDPDEPPVSLDVVDELARRAFAGRLPAPLLLVARGTAHDVEAFACDDPSRSLRGLLLPRGTRGVCLVATGTAHHDTAPGHRRALVIFRLDRSGEAALHLRLESEDVAGGEAAELEGEPEGLLADTLRRLLGLATPPPPTGLEALFSLEWLAAVHATLTRRGSAPAWAQLAVLHPAVRTHDDGPYDDLVERCELAAGALTWELLRTLVAAGAPRVPAGERRDEACAAGPIDLHVPSGTDRPPDHRGGDGDPTCPGARTCPVCAAWFDEGSFARAVLADLPDPDAVLEDLDRRLPPDLARRVRTTVAPFLELR